MTNLSTETKQQILAYSNLITKVGGNSEPTAYDLHFYSKESSSAAFTAWDSCRIIELYTAFRADAGQSETAGWTTALVAGLSSVITSLYATYARGIWTVRPLDSDAEPRQFYYVHLSSTDGVTTAVCFLPAD